MRTIYKIAKTELQTLFYSPVAWLILIVFTIQSIVSFTGSIAMSLRSMEMGWGLMGDGMTHAIFAHPMFGFLKNILGYLYLYIPLLTMGLMSRELNSGSIKLLYSSPISNVEIIFGKYLSMMVYGLILIVILLIVTLLGAYFIPDFDYAASFTALLGFYLLICTYAAIGLFMSCLTSYQVVAAIMTLAMLAVLDMVKNWGQEYDFVREVTYWLAIPGRANEFIAGLICSEDVLYFVIVSALFLSLSVIRLNANRQQTRWTVNVGKYVGVVLLACFLGYLSSLPTFKSYYDATETKRNTLTENSQEVVGRMTDNLTITTYVNALDMRDLYAGLPSNRASDRRFFDQYTRFKPDIKMKYVLYYDSIPGEDLRKNFPGKETIHAQMGEICRIYGVDSNLFIGPEEIRARVDLLPENNKYVRLLECGNGKSTYLRVFNDMIHVPTEAEITAAFKRLVMELPTVGFAVGQEERNHNFALQKDFRYALINQGFEVSDVNFEKEIPSHINIVVIVEPKREFNDVENLNLDKYLARGGNLLIMAEPRRAEVMVPLLARFGVRQLPGTLVRKTKQFAPDLVVAKPTKEAAAKYYHLAGFAEEHFVTMPSVSPLEYDTGKGYDVIPLLQTDSLYWNELETTDFVDDSVSVNPGVGEVQKSYVTALALSRKVGDKEQRIMIFPDADCLSNSELNASRRGIRGRNFSVIQAAFFWMSDDEVPIDVRRPEPTDTKIDLTKESLESWKIVLHWVFPILLVLIYLFVWIRRRGR